MFKLYNVLSISNFRVRKFNYIYILFNEWRNQTSSQLVILRLYYLSYKNVVLEKLRVYTKNIIIVYSIINNFGFI